MQRIDYKIWEIPESSYSKWFTLIEQKNSITTNRPFDFTQKNFSRVKLKFLIDALLYFFRQADSECLILQKK